MAPIKMKTLVEYAELAWDNSFSIPFGVDQSCPADMFTLKWVETEAPGRWCNEAGWYWILTDAPQAVLRKQRNVSGCEKALDIAEAVSLNENTLPPEALCSAPDKKFRVVYNGTEERVFSRLRNHTATTNGGPYSIGLNFYPDLVKNHRWSARIFHIGMIDGIKDLTDDEKRVFKALGVKHARARVAVEMAWRMRYGWPLFNRKGLEERKRTGAVPGLGQEDES